jgi:hypothetical protein
MPAKRGDHSVKSASALANLLRVALAEFAALNSQPPLLRLDQVRLVGVLGEENRGNSDHDDLAIERQRPHARIIGVARYACFVGRATATGDLPKSRNPWPASRIGCYRCAIS